MAFVFSCSDVLYSSEVVQYQACLY